MLKSERLLVNINNLLTLLIITIMSLIKKANELVIPTTIKMMLYGQAGMGKTTVALSAPKP